MYSPPHSSSRVPRWGSMVPNYSLLTSGSTPFASQRPAKQDVAWQEMARLPQIGSATSNQSTNLLNANDVHQTQMRRQAQYCSAFTGVKTGQCGTMISMDGYVVALQALCELRFKRSSLPLNFAMSSATHESTGAYSCWNALLVRVEASCWTASAYAAALL